MKYVQKGSQRWEAIEKNSTAYQQRLDYEKIEQQLKDADEGDLIVIERQHSNRPNVLQGLERRGLKHHTDFLIKLSVDEILGVGENKEVIVIVKL